MVVLVLLSVCGRDRWSPQCADWPVDLGAGHKGNPITSRTGMMIATCSSFSVWVE